MASRQIEINITGESGQYEATVQRIIEKNNQMNRAAVQGAEQTAGAFGNIQRILINLPSLFGGIATGIAGAFSIGAIIGFTKNILNAAGQIDDLSKKTGFTRQTLSGLKSTIEENGGSLQAFATAINKAQKSLGDIEGDGKKAGAALKAMGLDVNALTKATPEQFFEKFAKALSQVEGQNQRVAIATKVMGRAGADQIPIILELTDKFVDLRQRGVSEQALKQLDNFGDALTRLNNKMIGIAQTGLAALITGFDRLFKISDIEKQRGALADYEKQLESIDNTLKRREGLRAKGFGFFTPSKDDDAKLLAQRSETLQKFIDANDKLIRLEQGDKDKPQIGGGGSLPKIDEGAAKRQLDALEAAKTKLAQVGLQMAEARRAAGEYNVEVRSLALALYEQEKAAAVAAAKGNKSYTEELGRALEAEKQNKIAQFEAAEAVIKRKDELQVLTGEIKNQQQAEQDLAAVTEATKKDTEILNARKLEEIEIIKQLNDLEVQRLTIIGNTTEAERLRLLGQIEYIEALKKRAEAEGQDNRVRDAQLRNVQTQVQQLGTVTINVGNTIASSLGDAFEGVILGTRKLADVGKGLMAALLRDIGQFFTQALIKKLGFENLLLSNANTFGPQIAGAITGGASTGVLPGSQQQGGGLGLQNIVSNLVSGLGKIFGVGGGGNGGIFANFPAASSAADTIGDISGFTFSALGGAGGGGAGGSGFGLGSIGSIVSLLSTAWTTLSETLLGAEIAAAATTIASSVSTTITATLTTITEWLATVPIWGWIAAAVLAVITGIYRIIANQQERPNAKFSGQFEGVSFDESLAQFVPGAINVAIGRKSGIKNSAAGAIADNLQKRLVVLADQWVGILNIFPDFIAEDIQPALDETNRRLNQNFANLKFSPGGSRSIQQELESLSGPDGLVRFFNAFQPSLAQAFATTLKRAGSTLSTNLEGFNAISPGFKKLTPEVEKEWADFIQAIKDVAGLTSQLGKVGAGKFLTASDSAGIASLFDQLFSTSDAPTFTKAAAELAEKLKPALDFLEKSTQEAADLFGRGLIAALDAATASEANQVFLQTLGEGVKEVLFRGITDAFIASAQFNDLLAPIQQTIREFTQEAIQSGQTPDIGAFRAAILPRVEDIATRAQALAPLIAALQELGFDFKDALKVFGSEIEEAVTEAAKPVSVEINIENYTNESDPAMLARRIQELLSGRLQPAV